MYPLILAEELLEKKGNNGLVLIDARSGKDARRLYDTEHLESAYFIDLEKQLSDIKENAANGGRHPLPSVEAFATSLRKIGIDPNDHLVVYDDKSGANAAARFWWMMKAVGHEKIQVLDGGYQAAIAAGFPVTAEASAAKSPTIYNAVEWMLPMADMAEVDTARNDSDYYIIDVREAVRYDGITEPIDLVAGHIPGAHNIPFSSNLDAEGKYLPASVLKEKYEQAIEGRSSDKVIVHCGSGVTACHTLLAMDAAGMDIPNLYVGSWSEWSRNDKPMATSENPG